MKPAFRLNTFCSAFFLLFSLDGFCQVLFGRKIGSMFEEIANINKAGGERTPTWVVQAAHGFPKESDR